MHEALFYQQEADGSVFCHLCHHFCHIQPGKRGRCGVRENQSGQLKSLVYGLLVAESVDPIEKKPMFHLLPGSTSYSIATVGCNFHCLHCQNHQISQYPQQHTVPVKGSKRNPAFVVEQAIAHGCESISYTYVEPTIFYEFAYDCAQLARQRGLKNIFVSNGYMTPEVGRHLVGVLDGINIDLKSFHSEFYKKICKAKLEPVCANIRLFYELGVVVEVTTLVIPGLNDSEEELRDIARFLVSISPDIPWHVSGFRPTYTMVDRPPTSLNSLIRAREIGIEEGLRYVYTGNMATPDGADTFCPACRRLLIGRQGFRSQVRALSNGRCTQCQAGLYGVWK